MSTTILEDLRAGRKAVSRLRLLERAQCLTAADVSYHLVAIEAAFTRIMGEAAEARASGQLLASEADGLMGALAEPRRPSFTVIEGGAS